MLNIPQTINEVYNRIVADFKTYNKNAQPAVKNSWIGSILVAISGRIYDIYKKLNFILKQAFIDTATGEYLKRWGSYVGIYQKSATKSSGNFIITGSSVEAIVPINTQIIAGDVYFTTNNSIEMVQNTLVSSNYSQEEDLVTIVFENNHNLGTGMTVDVNGTDYVVEVLDATTINIVSEESIVAESLTVSWIGNIVSCTSTTYGENTNIASGVTGKLASVISNIDIVCYTDYAGFTGGQDIEQEDSLRDRIIYRYQNPVTNFNDAAIITFLQGLSNVGQVKVHDITPDVGQVTIYYLLNNNQVPTAGHLEMVQSQVDTSLRPANTAMEDIFINAGSPVSIDISITNIVPNTTAIKQAIKDSIKDYFDNIKLEETFRRNDIIEIIKSSIDLETGLSVESFDLDNAVVDVEMDNGEFAKLGEISI